MFGLLCNRKRRVADSQRFDTGPKYSKEWRELNEHIVVTMSPRWAQECNLKWVHGPPIHAYPWQYNHFDILHLLHVIGRPASQRITTEFGTLYYQGAMTYNMFISGTSCPSEQSFKGPERALIRVSTKNQYDLD